MEYETALFLILLVTVVAALAIRRVRRRQLMRAQRKELQRAERDSSPDRIRTMKARHAFERGDNTQAMRYLHKKLPDP